MKILGEQRWGHSLQKLVYMYFFLIHQLTETVCQLCAEMVSKIQNCHTFEDFHFVSATHIPQHSSTV